MKNTTLPFALLVGLAGVPLAASADHNDQARPGFFIGGGVGSNSLNGADYTGNGNDVEDRQTSYKALAGFRVNQVVSLEAQYIDFGTAEGGNNAFGGNRVKAHGVTAGGTFEAPISRFFHPYAKAQALFWDADGSFNGQTESDTGVDFAYGGGARFILGRNVDIRGEYERFEFQDSDVHTISAMLQLNF
jgi:OmpA-OmpF porin, OOP family